MLDAIGDGRPRSRATTASRAKGGLLVSGGFVVVLFVIEVVNMLTLHALNRTFGLRPRSLDGLLDIFTFPLLHANMNHLLSNALPLVVFGFLVFLSGLRVFLTALAFSWLGSGLTVSWSMGASCWACCRSWAASSPGRHTLAGRRAEWPLPFCCAPGTPKRRPPDGDRRLRLRLVNVSPCTAWPR